MHHSVVWNGPVVQRTDDPLKQQRSSHPTSAVSNLHMRTSGLIQFKICDYNIKSRSAGRRSSGPASGPLLMYICVQSTGPLSLAAASLAWSLARCIPCLPDACGDGVVAGEAEVAAGVGGRRR